MATAAAHPLAKELDSDAAGNVRQTLEDGRTITNYADGTSVMRTKMRMAASTLNRVSQEWKSKAWME